jgi:outer membrane immunogenic protein
MSSMKKVLLSTATLFALTTGTMAADLPPQVMTPAPVFAAVPVFTWTGAYAGVSGGYLWNETGARLEGTSRGGAAAGIKPNFLLKSDGYLIGGQVGSNMQIGAFVIGLEADASYTDVSTNNSSGANGGGARTKVVRSDLDYLGTVRGRLGVAFDRVMIYGTGGLAYGGVTTRVGGDSAASTTLTGRTEDTAIGWAAGAGVEWAFTNNMTFKAEYLHYDLEDQKVALKNAAGREATSRFSNTGDLIRGGINVKF